MDEKKIKDFLEPSPPEQTPKMLMILAICIRHWMSCRIQKKMNLEEVFWLRERRWRFRKK